MRPGKELMLVPALLVGLLLGPGSGLCAVPPDQCASIASLSLTDEQFGKPVMNLTATKIDVAPSLPAHCDVRGTIWPEIGFAVKLPIPWNGKFYMVGNGGKAGNIEDGAMANGLKLNYVTASTNTGHDSTKPGNSGSQFAYNPPDNSNPNARQKLIDFGYRAVHETAVISKKIMLAYYKSAPAHSYFVGCSTGGRQGLMEAQRYPDDFDGIVAGAPVYKYMTVQMIGPEYLLPQLATGSRIPPEKLAMLGKAVYDKCDSMDGLVDGLIDDPRKCNFDPDEDLLKCANDADSPECFTTAQLTAIKKIYAGAFTNGKPLVPGLPKGAEAMAGGWSPWLVNATAVNKTQWNGLVWDAYKYLVFDPPRPDYDFYKEFSFDTTPSQMSSERGQILEAVNPDLRPFKARGGKMLLYHGWADCGPNPLLTLRYYHEVVNTTGDAAKDLLKFYLVPGMGHCSGGVGCDKVDWVTPLANWVETGREPGALIGAAGSGTPRTRPICPYPKVARYGGTGSVDDAANFTCVKTVPARVRIEPGRLNLKSKGALTVSMTLPENMRGWRLRSVVCEGAPAAKINRKGRIYRAKFNVQDLKNVTVGNGVIFTVYVIAERGGRGSHQGDNVTRMLSERNGLQVAFEGSGPVKVIE